MHDFKIGILNRAVLYGHGRCLWWNELFRASTPLKTPKNDL